MQETVQENKMREIFVEKVTLNCGTGGPGDKLEKSLKLLAKLSGMKPVSTKAGPNTRIPTWGVRPGLELGCRVTTRGKKAEELLKLFMSAKKNRLKESSFDNNGNFAFGIHEYLDIPGIEYDADIGIIGFELAITLARKGFRIRRRSLRKRSIPAKHKINKEDAINFMEKKYGAEIVKNDKK
ncbi:50S ribosomal protein L5 [Candidatus Woesearchaeota archaeon]|jgi:large subunit ribosomal protein L5|nr:50S ribosomal protein L5 [Candidatus Woesearchaeota archaeon]MBT6044945.1 50S ribosomal protein L5 [Candidatus Woesearchaeota archaeon]